MKTTINSLFNRNQILIGLLLLFFLTSCYHKVSFNKSTVVPAADAKVKIQKGKNDNYQINLSVENLATPQDLVPSRKEYVVWVISTEGNFNVGKLEVGKNKKSSLETSTPYKPIRLEITAEQNATVTEKKGLIVLTTESMDIK